MSLCLMRERAAAGLGGVAGLQRGDEAARIVAELARLVEGGIAAGAARSRRRASTGAGSSASVAGERRGEIGVRPRRAPAPPRRARPADRRRRPARAPISRGGHDAVAQAGEIARPAAAEAEPGRGPGHVGRAQEDAAQALALEAPSRRAMPPPRDGAPMAATSVSGPLRRSARSRAPPGVTVRSMAASRLPARSPESVRVSSRLARVAASMASVAAGTLAARRRQRRARAELRALDVEEGAAGGGDLGAAEGAEGVERRRRRRTP